jgi:hypothetical protein
MLFTSATLERSKNTKTCMTTNSSENGLMSRRLGSGFPSGRNIKNWDEEFGCSAHRRCSTLRSFSEILPSSGTVNARSQPTAACICSIQDVRRITIRAHIAKAWVHTRVADELLQVLRQFTCVGWRDIEVLIHLLAQPGHTIIHVEASSWET